MQITNCRTTAVNASSIGDQTVIAAPGGAGSNLGGTGVGSITVWATSLEGAGANVLQFKSHTTALGGPYTITAAGGTVIEIPAGVPYYKCAAGQELVLNLTTGAAITGTLYWTLG